MGYGSVFVWVSGSWVTLLVIHCLLCSNDAVSSRVREWGVQCTAGVDDELMRLSECAALIQQLERAHRDTLLELLAHLQRSVALHRLHQLCWVMLTSCIFAFLPTCWLIRSVLWRCWSGVRKGIWPVKTEWWGSDVVICLERGADLHIAQLMPLPLTVSCFSKIPIGLTFLVPAHPGSPRQRAVKRVCVCVCVRACVRACVCVCAGWSVVFTSCISHLLLHFTRL